VTGNERQKGIDESLGFSRCLVHLPIGGNQRFTGHFSSLLSLILVDGIEDVGDNGHNESQHRRGCAHATASDKAGRRALGAAAHFQKRKLVPACL
jgi:hypothetical protein